MSCYRQLAQLDVPPAAVRELAGNLDRHPEWWPRVVGVQCDDLEEGCRYRQVHELRRYFRRWLEQSIEGLRRPAAREEAAA
jgi:hypothetical protein